MRVAVDVKSGRTRPDRLDPPMRTTGEGGK